MEDRTHVKQQIGPMIEITVIAKGNTCLQNDAPHNLTQNEVQKQIKLTCIN